MESVGIKQEKEADKECQETKLLMGCLVTQERVFSKEQWDVN
jgi:hypothetical protein